jgi:hypothetical protein
VQFRSEDGDIGNWQIQMSDKSPFRGLKATVAA